jgi:sulfhydrogenase subunit beta (sulfur reductase)
MRMVKLAKRNLNDFIAKLDPFGDLHAPVTRRDGSLVYSRIESPEQITLQYTRTILPPKKYFTKPVDTMFTFSPAEGYEAAPDEATKRTVLFGIHPCDIHGIKILDLVFGGRYRDEFYFARRRNTAIIGIDCIPDEHCFCRSTGTDFTEDGFDLFFSDTGTSYLVRVGTSLGDDMVLAASSLFGEVRDAEKEAYKRRSSQRIRAFETEIHLEDLPEIMDLEYESGMWEDLGKKCLSCGSCSMVCPTCYCYDVLDELDLDAESGRRLRRWDSCLFKDYALVAGGHDFRPDRGARIKNRYFHKQRGFVAQYGRPSCVGCGRCIVACPAGISIVDVITRVRSGAHE